MEKSVFQILNEYDITEHLKKKDKIVYLPWSKAWMIVKSLFPSAKFTINKAADGCIYHTPTTPTSQKSATVLFSRRPMSESNAARIPGYSVIILGSVAIVSLSLLTS